VRAYAAVCVGLVANYRLKSSISRLVKEQSWLIEAMLVMLKSGTELEHWGAMTCLAGLTVAAPDMSTEEQARLRSNMRPVFYSALKFINIAHTKHVVKHTLFHSASDIQFKLEAWTSAVRIVQFLLVSSERFDDDDDSLDVITIEQNGVTVLSGLVAILKFIAVVHHVGTDDPESIAPDNRFRPPQRTLAEEEEYQQTLALAYNDDMTLPRLILTCLNLIQTMVTTNDAIRALIDDPDQRDILRVYETFADPNVRAIVAEILAVKADITGTDWSPSVFWPVHLNRPPIQSGKHFCNGRDSSALPIIAKQFPLPTELEPFVALKTCGNPSCHVRETRRNQFISGKIESKWFCSRACLAHQARSRHHPPSPLAAV
jgi:hypothetical protein